MRHDAAGRAEVKAPALQLSPLFGRLCCAYRCRCFFASRADQVAKKAEWRHRERRAGVTDGGGEERKRPRLKITFIHCSMLFGCSRAKIDNVLHTCNTRSKKITALKRPCNGGGHVPCVSEQQREEKETTFFHFLIFSFSHYIMKQHTTT